MQKISRVMRTDSINASATTEDQIKKKCGLLFKRESKLPTNCIEGMMHLKLLSVLVFGRRVTYKEAA